LSEQQFHELTIGTCRRQVRIVEVQPGVRIAFVDMVGDMEFIDVALRALTAKVPDDFEVILGGDTVGMLIAHHLGLVSGRPYVVARKKRTPAMAAVLTAEAQSIAAQQSSTFWLGRHHADALAGRHVLVADEVTSTGSTLRALRSLAEQAGAKRITQAVIATEGEPRDDVISLAHLPVWKE
jgi:adenine phosphoribosyltransferase